MRRFTVILFLAFFAFLVPSREMAFADGGIKWTNYPQGVPVCTVSGNQQNIRMAPDGSGGVIIVWEDYRSGVADIYAQRIGKDGNRLWGQDGMAVAVSTPSCKQLNPVVVGDDTGGAIIAWEDYRNVPYSNIYALRISSTGVIDSNWTAGGVALSLVLENQSFPDIADVGSKGAVITWKESDASFWAIKAQRIGLDGTLGWLAGQEIVSQGMEPREYPKIINDGMEYVIVTWQDFRHGNYDIYAQRKSILDGIIALGWKVNGSTVTVASDNQKNPEIAPDGMGGAIIVWTDNRNSSTTGPDIYAQWINFAGVRRWETVTGSGDFEGIPVCQAQREQKNPVIVSRLEGETIKGAIFSWEDKRVDPNGDIYATGINLDIGSEWTADAIPIATGGQIQEYPRLVNDSQGGGIGAWRESSLLTNQCQIFATKRGEGGIPLWNSYPGVLVCQGSGIREHQIVSDGSGGIIVAWQAIGASGNYDIFAQRVVDAPFKYSASISGRVTLSDRETGITGVEVWALKGEELVSSAITDTKGYYGIVGLPPGSVYLVRANWSANGIESSVSKETFAPSYSFDFTLELDYELGTIAGNVSGMEREAKRVNVSGLKNSLSPGNGIAFVELEQRGKVIVRVPVELDGTYSIPNLLPGKFIARAYSGTIYSNSKMVYLKEGETLGVYFAFDIMPEDQVFNHPNPAKNGSTTITYYWGYPDPEAEIKIYDIAGELVRKVKDSEINRDGTDPHIYRFLWDCKNSSGKEVASGIYIYAVEVKEKAGSESKKVVKRMAVIR